MDVLTGLVVHFWPVWLLVLLRPVLGLVTATLFAAVRTSVDRGIAHDLPLNTGDWLRERLRALRLDREVDVLTSPVDQGAVDAYFPGSSFIQLSGETWLRTDAVGWATAAHELGHALNYRRARALHYLLVCARWGSRAAWTMGIAFVLANVLFGSVPLAQLAYGLILVSATLNATVVWDELWASELGMRLLRRDPRLDARQLDGAHMTMGAAFLSYASGLAGTMGVVFAYPRVADLTLAHTVFEPAPAPLAGPWLMAAVALSAALVLRSLVELHRFLRPPRYASASEAEAAMTARTTIDAAWTIPVLALLALVWNQPLGPVFVVAFAIAALPVLQTALRVLSPALPLVMLPLFLVLMPVLSWMMPDGDPHDPDPLGADLVDEVRADMERGHQELRAAQLRMVNDPPMYMRLGGLVRVAYLPLLVVLWGWLAFG